MYQHLFLIFVMPLLRKGTVFHTHKDY